MYPEAITVFSNSGRSLCLSFDDGPDPYSTQEIIKILRVRNIKAVFFCTGKNAAEFPKIVKNLVLEGHLIGNHTFSHADGFKLSTKKYVKEVSDAAAITSAVLFRPPYGRLTPWQYRILADKYKIVLWDLMAFDFKGKVTGLRITERLLNKIKSGSIIALHDNPLSVKKGFIEEFIDLCEARSFSFVLPDFQK
jgi:peptidoglycan/xylan/chitin deacetylase (PgdA/CDA1 family)